MTTENHDQYPVRRTCCPCDHDHSASEITRRGFLQGVGGAAAMGVALTGLTWSGVSAAERQDQAGPKRRPLVVKPILVYSTPTRRHQTSWRSWGGIQTQQDADQELARIRRELGDMENKADFPVQFLPPTGIRGSGELSGISDLAKADVYIVYAAGGGQDTFAKLAERGKDMIFFCRHKSGPVYLWYEIISPRYLRQHTDTLALKGIDDGDVVIDSQDEILWRLRALCGLHNAMGTRIIAIGGPGAWAQPRDIVPNLVRKIWKYDIQTVTYEDLGKLIKEARADNAAVAFRFTVDGEVWEAQRMLRRKGASQHALYRLEDDSADADKLDQVTGEVEVTARVTELLGLDFDAFGRSVLLAQGLQLHVQLVVDRPYVVAVQSGRDDEVVRDLQAVRHGDHQDVFRFLLVGQSCGRGGKQLGVYGAGLLVGSSI